MKNIHLFETDAAYDAAKNGLILPTVSYIKENKDVKYNPKFDANGHDFVEIAGIKWATMNVGAESITDYGLYFQWGDTQGYTEDQVGTGEGKKKFASDWSDYKFTTDGGDTFTKYNGTDNKTVLELVDDAVHANWGGSWRMPTKDDFEKLLDAVNTGWTGDYQGSKVAGMVCKDKNTQKELLFFPACGGAYGGVVGNTGAFGYYWLSSLGTDSVRRAYELYLGSGGAGVDGYGRFNGHCVRGVLAEN